MKLGLEDYLTYQLYTASKTPRIKKARLRSWIITTVGFMSLSYLFFKANYTFLGYYFLITSALSLTLYPFYSRWRYKRHYKKYIEDTYKNRFDEECILEITEDSIVTKAKSGEVRINTTEVVEINEINDFYFIKIKSGVSLIISKTKTDAVSIEAIKKTIEDLVAKKGLKHTIELDWKWR